MASLWMLAVSAAAAAEAVVANGGDSSRRPNFLMMLADDLGYNEVGFMNVSRGLPTPNLDRLASSGIVLTEYRVAPMCSPTRSATMCGRYITRLGTQSNTLAVNAPWGIDLAETMLPQNLKDAGYQTAMWGKWHLGMWTDDYTPTKRGFDHFVGYYQGEEDAYTHCNAYPNWYGYDWFVNGSLINTTGQWELPILRDSAVKFIERQRAATSPWFGYFAFREIHGPFEVPAEYETKFLNSQCCGGALQCGLPINDANNTIGVNATLCGMIGAMDDVVGDLVGVLNRSNQLQHTIIIWSSDNGAPTKTPFSPHRGASHTGGRAGYSVRNWPLKGIKGDLWDGGVKVPALVWSAEIASSAAAGTRSTNLYHCTDWLPTLIALARGNTKRNKELDGVDIWRSLIDVRVGSPRRELLINANPLPCRGAPVQGDSTRQAQLQQGGALIVEDPVMGRLKLVIPDGWPIAAVSERFLFNLTVDPRELHNIYNQTSAKIVVSMEHRLNELALQAAVPMTWFPPFQGPSYFCAQCPMGKTVGKMKAWLPWGNKSQ